MILKGDDLRYPPGSNGCLVRDYNEINPDHKHP